MSIGFLVLPLLALLGLLIVLGIPLLLIYLLVRLASGGRGADNPEDLRQVQEINRMLEKMERRVEALEVVLFEEVRKGDL